LLENKTKKSDFYRTQQVVSGNKEDWGQTGCQVKREVENAGVVEKKEPGQKEEKKFGAKKRGMLGVEVERSTGCN